MNIKRQLFRGTAALAATVALVLAGAGIAAAHVTATSPDQASKGGDAEIIFRVPNEEDTAGVRQLQVTFPQDTPIPSASPRAVPGWTVKVNMVHLAKPVQMANDTVSDAVASVVWTADTPDAQIAPGNFGEFAIWVEGLPTNTSDLVMPAAQTYGNGDLVNWNQPAVAGQPEPEHAAPHLPLAAGDEAAPTGETPTAPVTVTAASHADGTARWLGGIAVVLAAIASGFALGALTRSRRRPAIASPTAPEGAESAGAGPDSGEDTK